MTLFDNIQRYLEIKFKTNCVQICHCNSWSSRKIVLTVSILDKRYCLIIAKNISPQTYTMMHQLQSYAPKIIFYDTTKKYLPHDILLREYIEGETLAKIFFKKDVNFISLGKSIRMMHDLPLELRPAKNQFVETYGEILSTIESIKQYFPCLCHDLLKNINPSPLKKQNLVISHNDLHDSNIIVNNQGLPFLIDFEKVNYNLREYDIANLFLPINHYYPVRIILFLLNVARKRPLNFIKNRRDILRNLRFCGSSLLASYKRESKRQILQGYARPVSKDLLAYCLRLSEINELIYSLKINRSNSDNQYQKLNYFKNLFIDTHSIFLSNNTQLEIADHLKKLTTGAK